MEVVIIGFFPVVFLTLILYFLPALIAVHSEKSALAMFLLNLFLGWTILGWIALLFGAIGDHGEALREVIIDNKL